MKSGGVVVWGDTTYLIIRQDGEDVFNLLVGLRSDPSVE